MAAVMAHKKKWLGPLLEDRGVIKGILLDVGWA